MSDQDFFFEDEERTEEPAAPKVTAKPATEAGGARAGAVGVPLAQQSVSMTVAGLVAVCTLLVGVIVGILLPGPTRSVSVPTVTGAASAPQLTPEELGSGELPAGHPDISGMGGDGMPSVPGTTAGSGETTANQ